MSFKNDPPPTTPPPIGRYDTRDIGVPNEPLRQSRLPSWLPTKLQSIVIFTVLLIIAVVAVILPSYRNARTTQGAAIAATDPTPSPLIPGLAQSGVGQRVLDATPPPKHVPVATTGVPVGGAAAPGSITAQPGTYTLQNELKNASTTSRYDPNQVVVQANSPAPFRVDAPTHERPTQVPPPSQPVRDVALPTATPFESAPQTAVLSGGTAPRAISSSPASEQAAPAQATFTTRDPNESITARRTGFNSPAGAAPGYLRNRVHDPISDYEIFAGTPIAVVLDDSINTSLPGDAFVHVLYDVHGSIKPYPVLIPAFSVIQIRYNANVVSGDTRIQIATDTLKFPDGRSFDLSGMPAAESSGESGLQASVDDHRGRLFTTTLLSAVISAGLQLSQPATGSLLSAPTAGQQAAGAVGNAVGETASQLISQQVARPPTLTIKRGHQFMLRLRSTIVIEPPSLAVGSQ